MSVQNETSVKVFCVKELTFPYKMKLKFTYTTRNQTDYQGDSRWAREII